MRSSSLLPLLLVGFLAALTFWLERTSQIGGDDSGARKRHDPDFYVERFRVRRFGDDGTVLNTLVADKMLHYPDDDSTRVIAPQLTYHRSPASVVTAKSAWLDKDGKHVRLNDDVRVVRPGEAGAPDTVVTTNVLFVTPDDEQAETNEPVTITQGKTIITGAGGMADNKSRRYVLSGHVKGLIYHERKK